MMTKIHKIKSINEYKIKQTFSIKYPYAEISIHLSTSYSTGFKNITNKIFEYLLFKTLTSYLSIFSQLRKFFIKHLS